MARGKHRKQENSNNKTAAIITTGALSLGGVWATAGSANAAPESAWDTLAQCESSGQWNLPGGDRDSTGGLQFRVASWNDALAQLERDGVDTSAFGELPYQSTKNQQILAGEAYLKLAHQWGIADTAWTCNMPGYSAAGVLDGYPGGDYGPYLGGDSLPPADPIDPVPGDSHPSAEQPPADPEPEAPAPADDGCGHSTHTVRSGDTLYGITKAHTGDGSLDNWKALYAANKGVVGADPDLIFPGQVLDLPWAHGEDAPPAEAPADPAPEAPAPVEEQPEAPAPVGDFVPPLADMSGIGDGYFAGPNGGYSRSDGGHSGLDITAPSGTPVHAVASGTVTVGGAGEAYGIHVLVDHGDGVWTLYAHLSGTDVMSGQTVSAGDTIGSVGSTGNSSGPHLHFEVRTNGLQFNGFLDPVGWLKSKGIL